MSFTSNKEKINYLKFHKKISESTESGFSYCRRASRTRSSAPGGDESLNHIKFSLTLFSILVKVKN
jgi:hypothetical protein